MVCTRLSFLPTQLKTGNKRLGMRLGAMRRMKGGANEMIFLAHAQMVCTRLSFPPTQLKERLGMRGYEENKRRGIAGKWL
jgi:hypothetical protein